VELLNQSIDTSFQFDLLDDFSTFRPIPPLQTTFTPELDISSSNHSHPLSTCPNKVLLTSKRFYSPDSLCTEAQPPPLQWELISSDRFHGSDKTKDISNKKNINTGNTAVIIEKGRVPESLEWEHISSTELKPHEAIKKIKQPRKITRRQGPLNPETAKNAKRMRKTRACLPCKIQKRTVSQSSITLRGLCCYTD
jgi:hypothetical protein